MNNVYIHPGQQVSVKPGLVAFLPWPTTEQNSNLILL